MPARSRKIAVVAHCHLNVNTKVCGLGAYASARTEVIAPLLGADVGIVQLPCPEVTFLGMRRWGMTVEQYDTPAYRRHCRSILESVVDTLQALAEDGCAIEGVIGVDLSPSCGVNKTCAGYAGGELSAGAPVPGAVELPGRGIFMEEFEALLASAGLNVSFAGVDE